MVYTVLGKVTLSRPQLSRQLFHSTQRCHSPVTLCVFEVTVGSLWTDTINNVEIIKSNITHVTRSSDTLDEELEYLSADHANLSETPLCSLWSYTCPNPGCIIKIYIHFMIKNVVSSNKNVLIFFSILIIFCTFLGINLHSQIYYLCTDN